MGTAAHPAVLGAFTKLHGAALAALTGLTTEMYLRSLPSAPPGPRARRPRRPAGHHRGRRRRAARRPDRGLRRDARRGAGRAGQARRRREHPQQARAIPRRARRGDETAPGGRSAAGPGRAPGQGAGAHDAGRAVRDGRRVGPAARVDRRRGGPLGRGACGGVADRQRRRRLAGGPRRPGGDLRCDPGPRRHRRHRPRRPGRPGPALRRTAPPQPPRHRPHGPAPEDPAPHGPASDESRAAAGSHGPGTDHDALLDAVRQAITGKAVDLVSGPGGLASHLRRRQLGARLAGPSLPLDIGYSATIPAAIRTAVTLRTASGPASATSPRQRAKCTTWSTRPTAARPASRLPGCTARSTTRS